MSVKLIAYTQWHPDFVRDTDIMAYCARVSNPDNQDNPNYYKLLSRCREKKEWSVFEMCNLVMEVNTTRDMAHQIIRHSSLKPQEFSQRYANVNDKKHVKREGRLQDTKNRQSSTPLDPQNAHHEVLRKEFLNSQQRVWDVAIEEYNRNIAFGFAKECCRVLLPEGLCATRMYLNGNVRDWYHYCQVRMDKSTQKEHQDIAMEVCRLLYGLYPYLNKMEAAE